MKPKLKLGLIASVPIALFLSLGGWLGRELGLTGWGFYLFWLAFGALGTMIGGAIFWFMGRLTTRREGPSRPPLEEDLLARLSEIKKRLDSARRPGIQRLPTVLLVGPAQGGKSSTVLGAEVAAEPLAGDRFGGGPPPPTKSINAWFADGTVFLEAGEALREDTSLWQRLVQNLRPKRLLAAVLMGKPLAPRAAVVCFPCGELQRGGLETAQAWGRSLRSSLLDLSQRLGVRVPVYVLFTKADEVPSFPEYCANLKGKGTGQVLGSTLPLAPALDAASYGDRQTRTLKTEFDELFRSLAGKRLKVLDPDSDPMETGSAYEFPREFQKLSAYATHFLVELCKPNPLQVSPFLRGFYFVGRQEQDTGVPAPEPREPVDQGFMVAGATQVFDPQKMGGLGPSSTPSEPQRATTGHRQLFLPRVFRDVVLQDAVAAGLTGRGQRVHFGRRLVLGLFFAVFLFFFTPLLVGAFDYNRGLQTRADAAIEAVGNLATDQGLDTTDRLRRLGALSELADTLADLRATPPVWRFARWFGLFSGSRLHPRVLDEYGQLFRPLLLEPSLESIERELRTASQNGRTEDWNATYRRLRTYLMATTNPERLELDFLPEGLAEHWPSARTEEERELALGHFEFFGRRLLQSPGFRLPAANGGVVEDARTYLVERGGPEPFYQFILAKANRIREEDRFDDRSFGSSSPAIRILETVPGAFSPGGWDYVKGLLVNEDSLGQAEEWVLGPVPILDRRQLGVEIDSLYTREYRNRWERLLTRASVTRFRDASDASEKLAELSGEYAQLTQLFRAVYERASVLPPNDFARFEVLRAFFQQDSLGEIGGLSPVGSAYLDGLRNLESAMSNLATAQDADRISVAQSIMSQGVIQDAQRAASDLKREVGSSMESRVLAAHVSRIVDEPIGYAGAIVGGEEARELNRQGAEFCREYQRLVGGKYPIQPRASDEPTMEDFAEVFQPSVSLLWNFLERMDPYVEPRGSRYHARGTTSVTINPDFLAFLGNARAFSQAVFPQEGGATPEVRFRLRPILDESSQGIESVTLDINGRPETCSPTACRTSDEYVWTGGGATQLGISARVAGENVPIAGPFRGPWAAYRFFNGTAGWGGAEEGEHTIRWGFEGRQGEVAMAVVGRVSAVFDPRILSGLTCVETIAVRR